MAVLKKIPSKVPNSQSPESKTNRGLKQTRKVYNIIATVSLVVQLLGYFGIMTSKTAKQDNESLPFYLGFNIFLIIAIILYYKAFVLKRKQKNDEYLETINSIGE